MNEKFLSIYFLSPHFFAIMIFASMLSDPSFLILKWTFCFLNKAFLNKVLIETKGDYFFK